MKRIKVYNLRRDYRKQILIKSFWFSAVFILFAIVLNNVLNISVWDLLTDVLSKQKISKTVLYEKADKLTFNWTTWPVKEITDLSYQSIKNSSYSYSKLRNLSWDDVPENLRTFFPKKVSSYIDIYKNITLQTCWDYFSNPDDLNKFTFMRRIIRATWTASYESKKIWIKGSWTHAWVDIIWNVWTPLYAIANGLVIEKKKSNKWFGNSISLLVKVDNKYYVVFYGHMHSLNNKIKVGDLIKKWDIVWTMWHSWNSFWTHLHIQINKVFALQDIVNGRVMLWWYHNLDWVKAYTIDPISFIEKYYKSVWDNFNQNTKKEIIKEQDIKKQNIKKEVIKKENDNFDLINAVAEDLKHNVSAIKKVSYIKSIDWWLIDNKIELWHSFTTTINVSTWVGNIGILSDNENISFSKNIITNPDREVYKINFIAKKVWTTNLKISDGKSIRNFKVEIYSKNTNNVFWIKIVFTWNLNLLTEKKIIVYPIDKLGRVLDTKIVWNFKVYLVSDNWDKKLLKNLYLNGNKWEFYIKWEYYWKWKIIIDSWKYYLKQNIITDLAVDSDYKYKYSKDILKLIKKWIVKWDNGKLYLNRLLSRREFLTILARWVLKVDYKKEKQNMLDYLKIKWRFFKDISWKVPTDVYIYVAYKKWIIKWYKGYSLVNTNVSKLELLTILLRMYKIKANIDNLNIRKDINWNNNIKAIADTTKKFWLYPFSSYNYFDAWKLVSRWIAFETLYRFMDLWNIYYHTSWNDSNISKKNVDSDLENTISDIFNF